MCSKVQSSSTSSLTSATATAKPTTMTSWDNPTQFVVTMMVILYICSWVLSLSHVISLPFWDPKYALKTMEQQESSSSSSMNNDMTEEIEDETDNNTNGSIFTQSDYMTVTYKSYLTVRYIFFLPHVIGALIWWNLYFLQLIPSIRHKYRTFHRWLGRLLMITALSQVVSGVGMAWYSPSSIIKYVSFILAIAITYSVYHAVRYARAKDFVRHRIWAMRVVGYLQTIAAQRFWLFIIIATHQAGFNFFYPPLLPDDDHDNDNDDISLPSSSSSLSFANTIVARMFDDSFVLAILSSILVTEWYLAQNSGMMDPPNNNTLLSVREGGGKETTIQSQQNMVAVVNEHSPLVPH